MNRYVLPSLADMRLDRLNAQNLQEWKNSVARLRLTTTTQQNIYSVFRGALNYAVKLEYLPRNPLLAVGNFKDKDFAPAKDKLHYYTPEEFLRYKAVAREKADEKGTLAEFGYYVFFCIAYYMGMRKGEINALRWSDIDGNVLTVRRSLTQKIKGKKGVETLPKNKTSYRSIEIPQPLMDILAEYKKRLEERGAFGENFRVCGGGENGYLSDTNIENHNRLYADAAGLPHIRIHDFRHSHASLLANESINIQEIARRLGHADVEMTWNTYAHLYPRESERSLAILNKVV